MSEHHPRFHVDAVERTAQAVRVAHEFAAEKKRHMDNDGLGGVVEILSGVVKRCETKIPALRLLLLGGRTPSAAASFGTYESDDPVGVLCKAIERRNRRTEDDQNDDSFRSAVVNASSAWRAEATQRLRKAIRVCTEWVVHAQRPAAPGATRDGDAIEALTSVRAKCVAALLTASTITGIMDLSPTDLTALQQCVYLGNEPAEGRDAVHYVLTRAIIGERLDFPFKRYVVQNRRELFKALQTLELPIRRDPYALRGSAYMSGALFPLELDDERNAHFTFVSCKEDYSLDVLTDCYTERERMAARRDSKAAPLDQWHEESFVGRCVERALGPRDARLYEARCDTNALREAVYDLSSECTQFKVSLAANVLRWAGAQRVLDFSAGWGDRLIGALAAGVQRYTAYDPNPTLQQGHAAIMHELGPLVAGDDDVRVEIVAEEAGKPSRVVGGGGRWTVVCQPFEKAHLDPQQTYNVVFTSPPFFRFEVYTERAGQSIASFSTHTDWLVCFLMTALSNAWRVLESNGHMMIHIADVSRTRTTEPMNLLAQWLLPHAHYRGVIASVALAGVPRPIWVWRKGDPTQPRAPADQDRVHRAELCLREYYRDVYNLACNHFRRGVKRPFEDEFGE